MRVYRIEDEEGQGPYRHYTISSPTHGLMIYAHNDNAHPSPQEEDLPMSPIYYCGFSKLSHLYEWFEEHWIPSLKENNYKIAVYEVSARCVHKGIKQVVFKKETAKLIRTRSL